MQNGPKDWDRKLSGVLEDLEGLHDKLRSCSLALRKALVQQDHMQARVVTEELRGLFSTTKAGSANLVVCLRESGLLGPDEPLSLKRLETHDRVRTRPELCAKLGSLERSARGAGRETALNQRLIERLTLWNQSEARILLEPEAATPGYGGHGQHKNTASQPALVDWRG